MLAFLTDKGIEYTRTEGWVRLDSRERSLGEAAGRARIKVVERDEMVRVSRAVTEVAGMDVPRSPSVLSLSDSCS